MLRRPPKRWKNTVPAGWRASLFWLVGAFVLLIGARIFLGNTQVPPGGGHDAIMYGTIGLFFIALAVHARQVWAVRQAARQSKYLLCPRCQYSLSGLKPEGACPECGESYTLEDVVQFWKSALIGFAAGCAVDEVRAPIAGHCSKCGYDLRGTPEGAISCTECGAAVRAQPLRGASTTAQGNALGIDDVQVPKP